MDYEVKLFKKGKRVGVFMVGHFSPSLDDLVLWEDRRVEMIQSVQGIDYDNDEKTTYVAITYSGRHHTVGSNNGKVMRYLGVLGLELNGESKKEFLGEIPDLSL